MGTEKQKRTGEVYTARGIAELLGPVYNLVREGFLIITARGMAELNSRVYRLEQEGFRIITVIDTQNGDYHGVAQKDVMDG